MTRTGRAWVLASVLLGLVAAGCSDSGPSEMERAAAEIAAAASATTMPSTTTAPSPTVAPSTSTSVAPGSTVARVTTPTTAPAGLGPGARGAEVAALELRLQALHYDVGTVDDI